MNPFEKDWNEAKVYEGNASPLAKAVIGPIVDKAIKEGVLPKCDFKINDENREPEIDFRQQWLVRREISQGDVCGCIDHAIFPAGMPENKNEVIVGVATVPLKEGDIAIEGVHVVRAVCGVIRTKPEIQDMIERYKAAELLTSEVQASAHVMATVDNEKYFGPGCKSFEAGPIRYPYAYEIQHGDNRIRIEFATHEELMAYIENRT